MSITIKVPVEAPTPASTRPVAASRQTRKPYKSVRLTQMKWNGTVSHVSQTTIATRFATANANHASSTCLPRKAVPDRAHGLDRRVRPELLAHAAHAHLDDVGARIELVSPDLGEQPLAADDLARAFGEKEQQPELPVRQVDRDVAE